MIIRTYRCNDCREVFDATLENGDAPDPDCPFCAIPLTWQPSSFNIGTVKGKAVDITQKMLEEDYGLTNFRDNTKPGETVIMQTPPTTSENDKLLQMASEIEQQHAHAGVSEQIDMKPLPLNPEQKRAIEGFWGGAPGGAPLQTAQAFLANARLGPEADSASKVIGALHKRGRALGISAVPRVIRPRG